MMMIPTGVCPVCASTARGEFRRAVMHPECIRAAQQGALVASAGTPALHRLLRIAALRLRHDVLRGDR